MAKIRLWKLGSFEHRVVPTAEGIRYLAKLIEKRDPKKDFDLVWGPDLELIELDSSKLNSIVAAELSVEEQKIVKNGPEWAKTYKTEKEKNKNIKSRIKVVKKKLNIKKKKS